MLRNPMPSKVKTLCFVGKLHLSTLIEPILLFSTPINRKIQIRMQMRKKYFRLIPVNLGGVKEVKVCLVDQ